MKRIEILSVDAVCSVAQDYLSDVDADTLKYSVENDGIGSYEFCGARSYDHGRNYGVIDTDLSFEIACPFTSNDDVNEAIADIKKYISRMFESGGCTDEHSGRCGDACAEYVVEVGVVDVHTSVSDDGLVVFSIELG